MVGREIHFVGSRTLKATRRAAIFTDTGPSDGLERWPVLAKAIADLVPGDVTGGVGTGPLVSCGMGLQIARQLLDVGALSAFSISHRLISPRTRVDAKRMRIVLRKGAAQRLRQVSGEPEAETYGPSTAFCAYPLGQGRKHLGHRRRRRFCCPS
jgi:hypothetical protein